MLLYLKILGVFISFFVGIQVMMYDSSNCSSHSFISAPRKIYKAARRLLARLVTLEEHTIGKLRHCQRRRGSGSEERRHSWHLLLGLIAKRREWDVREAMEKYLGSDMSLYAEQS